MNEKTSQPTIMRGLVLLEAVVQARRPISASDLIEVLQLPKPTVHRLLSQLESEGLLRREPVKRRYQPGPRAREMALGIMSHKSVGATRHTILKALSDEIGETCNLSIRDGGVIVYVDRVESNWPYRILLPVGSQLPIHCTASGKLMLAFMDARQRNRLLRAAPLEKFTERTITNPEQLNAALNPIKAEAVGIDDQEFIAGMAAVAVPVFDTDGEVCSTVSAHAPTARKPLHTLRDHIPAMRRAAKLLEADFNNAG